MSLQRLLSQYPSYSARKVRRLACQLETLERCVPDADGRGIAHDLMEYNLMQARGVEETGLVITQDPNPSPITVELTKPKKPVMAVDLDSVTEALARLKQEPTEAMVEHLRSILTSQSFTAFVEAE